MRSRLKALVSDPTTELHIKDLVRFIEILQDRSTGEEHAR